ncbi:hypothetical protein D3C76_872940 [compost metagenome]
MAGVLAVTLQNGTRTEKTDTGNDALDHPTECLFIGPRHTGRQHEQGGPQRHQHVGTHSGRLALVFALEAQYCAEHSSHQQAHKDLRDLALIGDIGEFRLDCLPDDVHRSCFPCLSFMNPPATSAGLPSAWLTVTRTAKCRSAC